MRKEFAHRFPLLQRTSAGEAEEKPAAGHTGAKMPKPVDETARRGNYESGADYVLEYGELRFSFNERDFAQRVEQAAVKLDFVRQGLDEHELEDLLELAVNGEIREPCSPSAST